ncbi:hypothetical protein VCUG_01541 [Vavraia culicis subsp. floridensis]|uniref:Uncharacterized protein n=1 Tax=Vavraia culicis (isolate floridensis) TaxID=948595 RepID=L2GV93_VAVCU|nr:uncharacterized protein VCUG_01541 [Vavraia culicis subsp. floridensis]ELA47010.1 hypothetical protein VCUG_01541 [Vavraia culicis subsp. floridensis]
MKEHIVSLILSISLVISFVCLNKSVKNNYRTFRSFITLFCSAASAMLNAILIEKKDDHGIIYTITISLVVALCDFVILYCTMESLKIHSIAFMLLVFISFCIGTFIFDRHVSLMAVTINSVMIVVLFMFELFEYNGVQLNGADLEITFQKPYMSLLFISIITFGFRIVLVYRLSNLIADRPFFSFFHSLFLMVFALIEAAYDSWTDVKIFYSEASRYWLIIVGSFLLLPAVFVSSQNMKWIRKETFMLSSATSVVVITCFYFAADCNDVFGKNRLEIVGTWFYACLLLIFTFNVFVLLFFRRRDESRAAIVSNVETIGADTPPPADAPSPADTQPAADVAPSEEQPLP